jgi:hypothetical protein
MTAKEEREIIDGLRDEALGYHASGAPMNALRRAAGLPELPDKKLQIEAPKIERELEMIRKELRQMNDILKRGLRK